MTVYADLGGGLILRSAATAADMDKIATLVDRYLSDGSWVRALSDGHHPNTNTADFTLVENADSGRVVSTMCIIPQTWTYGGIPFGVARMDLVATDEDYRWRGLLRAQFEALHQESLARGQHVQVVVGRPWVYRKFGYDMAMPYGVGTEVSRHGTPALAEGQVEPFRVRPAAPENLPYWTDLYLRGQSKALVACQRAQANWQHDIFERGGPEKSAERLQLRLIEDAREGSETSGRVIGGLVHSPNVGDGLLYVFALAIEPGISWLDLAPSLLRCLEAEGDAYAKRDGGRMDGFWFGGEGHPILAALSDHMQRVPPEGPFAWYVRLADPAGFLMHVAPVINQRVAGSVLEGWSGSLKINFYERETSGLTLTLEKGCLVHAENGPARGGAAMPIQQFKQILFGYRSVQQIEAECPEVALDERSRAILSALFPKQASRIFSVY